MNAKQLAAAIRKGHGMIGETHRVYFDGDNCGCAIGAAMIASGCAFPWRADGIDYLSPAARALSVDKTLLREISARHQCGTPRLAIADWLDSLDDSPADQSKFDAFMAKVTAELVTP